MTKISGRLVPFTDGRAVFLAKHPTKLRTYCVGFINAAGDSTRLLLSDEALDALVAMRSDPIVGTPEREFPARVQLEWRAVDAAR